MMAEKSGRRLRLEQSLADNPTDGFLRYGLAMACLQEGDLETGRSMLAQLIQDEPSEVAACQQIGQSHMEAGENAEARQWFQLGVERAKAQGNAKAAGEMSGFLELIGDD